MRVGVSLDFVVAGGDHYADDVYLHRRLTVFGEEFSYQWCRILPIASENGRFGYVETDDLCHVYVACDSNLHAARRPNLSSNPPLHPLQ